MCSHACVCLSGAGSKELCVSFLFVVRSLATVSMATDQEQERSCRVGNYSLDGLSVAWENCPRIRSRLRTHGSLLMQFDCKLKQEVKPVNGDVTKTLQNMRTNRYVLSPLANLMRLNSHLPPNIDRLINEVRTIYESNTIKVTSDVLYHNSWSIRYLLSLLKGELARITSDVRKGKYKKKDCVKVYPNTVGECLYFPSNPVRTASLVEGPCTHGDAEGFGLHRAGRWS